MAGLEKNPHRMEDFKAGDSEDIQESQAVVTVNRRKLFEIAEQNGFKLEARILEGFMADFKEDDRCDLPMEDILKSGNIQTLEAFLKITGFDLNQNQPILSYKLVPFACVKENFELANYLITYMDMEFRVRLFERSLECYQRSITRFLQPFLPSRFNNVDTDNPLFFMLVNCRFMSEGLKSKGSYYEILLRIKGHLNLKSLLACRSVCKDFKAFIDDDEAFWKRKRLNLQEFLKEKLETVDDGPLLSTNPKILECKKAWLNFVKKSYDLSANNEKDLALVFWMAAESYKELVPRYPNVFRLDPLDSFLQLKRKGLVYLLLMDKPKQCLQLSHRDMNSNTNLQPMLVRAISDHDMNTNLQPIVRAISDHDMDRLKDLLREMSDLTVENPFLQISNEALRYAMFKIFDEQTVLTNIHDTILTRLARAAWACGFAEAIEVLRDNLISEAEEDFFVFNDDMF